MESFAPNGAKRGSIDFDSAGTGDRPRPPGKYGRHHQAERNKAHQIVEEFMLAANETVAGHLEDPTSHHLPHPRGTGGGKGCGPGGIPRDPGHHPVRGKKLKPPISGRALSRAKGTIERSREHRGAAHHEAGPVFRGNVGHFELGRGAACPLHLPIRRYPDLIVHRIVKGALRGKYKKRRRDRAARRGPAGHGGPLLAAGSVRPWSAERDVVAMLKLRFMEDKLGESFDGIITGVAQFGFFVQLKELFIEGMVHVSMLTDDYYHYIEKQHCLRGERRKRVYRIGDGIRVRVDRVDRERKRIDFSPSNE